jgi:hypothetical protein
MWLSGRDRLTLPASSVFILADVAGVATSSQSRRVRVRSTSPLQAARVRATTPPAARRDRRAARRRVWSNDSPDDVMTLSAFVDGATAPTDDDLRTMLGRSHAVWRTLIDTVGERIGPVTELWARTSKSTGWGLRLRQKDRVILYMAPQRNQFVVSFALGEKAVAAALATRLPAAIREAIEAAPRYAEGRGVRITVTSVRQVPALVALAQVKWRH